ncbi:MAG: amidohydrolase [Deltaproteobacteria bacterium]|nr:amidohydrolase [Deltaproteobacteria bacterium]MBI3078208.1 amidohydrolase [Deltaproteobacteria bacterium]
MDRYFVLDWHVHAGEAEFFERYPHYADSFRAFWQPFAEQYGVDIFGTMNISLADKVKMVQAAGVDRAVLIGLDFEPDFPFKFPLEYLAGLEKQHPDVITAFPCLNPKKGVERAVEELQEMHRLGFKGVKMYPCFWGDPSDRRFYPLYEKLAEYGMIAMFHMGSQIAPGARLKWCLPYLLDDVAMDFRELTIVVAHMGWPWIGECVMGLARKNKNVYFDTGSLGPRQHWGNVQYTANEGIYHYIEQRLPDRILYGCDYPNMTPKEMVAGFSRLPVGEEFKRQFLGENARRLLRL